MQNQQYHQFCPIAMAADILEPRWTMLILCEMFQGSARFTEIQRGVPSMSPGLLTKRLRDLEAKGMITRHENDGNGQVSYVPTPMADELRTLIFQIGAWAHRNINPEVPRGHLDHRLLMWNIRRKIKAANLPRRKLVIQFILKQEGIEDANYWLIVKPDSETDICSIDPKHDVDLFVTAQLQALTSAWMGHSSFAEEINAERIILIGDQAMARSLSQWLIRSSFAGVERVWA